MPWLSPPESNSECLPLILLLQVQLSYGLSTEYSNKPTEAKAEEVDADQYIYAKYYVSQIMQLGEEGIRDAWYKVSIYCASSALLCTRLGDLKCWSELNLIVYLALTMSSAVKYL